MTASGTTSGAERASSGEGILEVRRTFAHPPERVFDAWTDPAGMASWMRPNPMGSAEVELEARPGGRLRIDMLMNGKRYEHRGEVREVERPRRLVFTWRAEWLPGGSVVTVELSPVDGGTEVVLRHEGLPDEDSVRSHTEGWGAILLAADRHLTGRVGTVIWTDLTVADADGLRDFYATVVGWKPEPVDMDGYVDYNMTDPADGTPRAGVCHARGGNADLPPVWLVYFRVQDLDAALDAVRAGGGELLAAPRGSGANRYAVIRDPAGTVCALATGP